MKFGPSRSPRVSVPFEDPYEETADTAKTEGAQNVVALRLFSRDGDTPVGTRSAEIGSKAFVIGRGEDCDWRLEDPTHVISPRHVALSRGEDGLSARDLSANGTFLAPDGRPLGAGRIARLGDRASLWLGDYRLEIDDAPRALDEFAELLEREFAAGRAVKTLAESAAAKDAAGRETRADPAAPKAGAPGSRDEDRVAAKVDAMLADPRFEWRSVARLAYAAGMDPEAMTLWLAERTDRYRLGRSGAGEPLARLRRPTP
jgi:predicted component of type VI protein secretion system